MVALFDGNRDDLRDECCHYASFHDGDVEGCDLNRLGSIIQGRPDGNRHICAEVFRDRGDGYPKLGRISEDCLRVLAGMSDGDIQAAAAAWQQTGIMVYGTVEGAARTIRELKG